MTRLGLATFICWEVFAVLWARYCLAQGLVSLTRPLSTSLWKPPVWRKRCRTKISKLKAKINSTLTKARATIQFMEWPNHWLQIKALCWRRIFNFRTLRLQEEEVLPKTSNRFTTLMQTHPWNSESTCSANNSKSFHPSSRTSASSLCNFTTET